MSSSPLPERHPVRDFFVLDILDVTPRSDIASMAHPIFSLSTKPETRILRYKQEDTIVEIHPSTKGLATIYDKDVLIYCISKLMHRKNNGEAIGPVVRITTHDLLVSTNRNTGGICYQRLEDTLDRLAGTRIKTNVATGEEISTQNFGIIEWYDYNRKASGFVERLKYLDIKLSDWLFRAIDAAEVLPISREYFRIRRPIDRRIYEIARKHCGKQASWKVSIGLLQKKCGSRQAEKHFAAHLRELVAGNTLPDYNVALDMGCVVFTRRDGKTIELLKPPAPIPVASFMETPPEPRGIVISVSAIERVPELAPRWDKYYLEKMYCAWAADKDRAHNEDARFFGWVKSFTKGKPPP
jgi:plasmid replication initiation protein